MMRLLMTLVLLSASVVTAHAESRLTFYPVVGRQAPFFDGDAG